MESKWGLVPDMGITSTLPRLVRIDVAKELTYTGRMISGTEAAALGLVTRVAEDPLAAAKELAAEIAEPLARCDARRQAPVRQLVARAGRGGAAARDRAAGRPDRVAQPDRGDPRRDGEGAGELRRSGACGVTFDLPYGVARPPGGEPRGVTRIGDRAIDLGALDLPVPPGTFEADTLNPFIALGGQAWADVRVRLEELADPELPGWALDEVELLLPVGVGDYVDFYSSRFHAENVSRLFRPDDEPLLPNWRRLPVGYHGRAGTVVVSGTPVRRPTGRLGPDTVGPEPMLDYELELAFVTGAEAIFGFALMNDWSARAIQGFEYQPLGPFLGKSFATSLSAWITPAAALNAYRVDGEPQDPEPARHLQVARAARARPRTGGGARRRGHLHHQRAPSVLEPRAAARPRDVQRRDDPPRRPLRLRHRLGPRAHHARLPARDTGPVPRRRRGDRPARPHADGAIELGEVRGTVLAAYATPGTVPGVAPSSTRRRRRGRSRRGRCPGPGRRAPRRRSPGRPRRGVSGPSERPRRKPALKASPQPVVSTTSISNAGTSSTPSASTTTAPSAPRVAATQPMPRSISARAPATRSSSPVKPSTCSSLGSR